MKHDALNQRMKENYEYVSKEIESMVKDVIGTCRVEIKYLDKTTCVLSGEICSVVTK